MSLPTPLMPYLATIVCLLFIFLSCLHVYWALGGKWGVDKAIPKINNESSFTPGKSITLLVALALLGMALLIFILGFYGSHSIFGHYLTYLAWLLAFVFVLRAIGDFNLVGFFKKNNDSDFAKYDSRYYSPLCLALAFVWALSALNAV